MRDRIVRPLGHIFIFFFTVVLFTANAALLTTTQNADLHVFLSAVVPTVELIIAANYERIKLFIDRRVFHSNFDIKLSLAGSKYGDIVAVPLVVFSVTFWFRTTIANLRWSFYSIPLFVNVQLNGGLRRIYFFGNAASVFDVDNGNAVKLHDAISYIIVLYLMWPALFVIGVFVGGFLILRTSAFYFRKVITVIAATFALQLIIEACVFLIFRTMPGSNEYSYITWTLPRDDGSVAAGLIAAWFIFFPLRTSDLTRLRVLLSFIPKHERVKTIVLLEELIGTKNEKRDNEDV